MGGHPGIWVDDGGRCDRLSRLAQRGYSFWLGWLFNGLHSGGVCHSNEDVVAGRQTDWGRVWVTNGDGFLVRWIVGAFLLGGAPLIWSSVGQGRAIAPALSKLPRPSLIANGSSGLIATVSLLNRQSAPG